MQIEDCWYRKTCQESCSNSCLRFTLMKSLCEKSLIPEQLWHLKQLVFIPDRVDQKEFKHLSDVKAVIDKVVDKGSDIAIYSTQCGNGKTTWAVRLMLAYFDRIWHTAGFECKGIYVNTITLLMQCKRNMNAPAKQFDELVYNLKTVPLVIWDDMGSGKLSDYDRSFLYDIISERKDRGLSNIYTMNCSVEALEEALDKRLFSRVYNNSMLFEFRGSDKRGKQK